MALFSKKNIKSNPFGLTQDDLKGDLEGFPMGVVVAMLEEQERQKNKPDIKVFCKYMAADRFMDGFDWDKSVFGKFLWVEIAFRHFDSFFKRHPEYEKYNIS